jgi:hypothetical protein
MVPSEKKNIISRFLTKTIPAQTVRKKMEVIRYKTGTSEEFLPAFPGL